MINSLEVHHTELLADGVVFGATGSYVKIVGVATGELDPNEPSNRRITDIDRASRNLSGMIEYKTDFFILRPSDPTKGNGGILYEVVNRGNKRLFRRLADAAQDTNDFHTATDFGNAFPLQRGYTLVWSGWDPTTPKTNGRMALMAPVASEAGRPITMMIRDEFAIGMRKRGSTTFELSYEAADLTPSHSRLTIRHHLNDARIEVPTSHWEFMDSKTARLLPIGTKPALGNLYEIYYPAKNAQVLGIGFAATRDLMSYLRYSAAAEAVTGRTIDRALAIGFSQGGRYLRDHISLGFNRDEEGRRVFDGVLAHTAGAGRVFLNYRFGQPFRTCSQHEDHDFPENAFPFSTATVTDRLTGQTGSLLRGDESDPLLIQTNTSTEYWQKAASLLHTDPVGERDLQLPSSVRVYLIAGTHHGGQSGLTSTSSTKTVNPSNPHNPMPVVRALLTALDEWVVSGRPPPGSKVPTLADQTLVPPGTTGFPDWPGIAVAHQVNEFGPSSDWVNPTIASRFYRPLVCKVDADGNEIAGIRTPDIAVPLGTYSGWNLYKSPFPDGVLADKQGSFLSFAATHAEREKTGDPRRSIAERYRNRAEYVTKVQEATAALLGERFLLPEDAARYVELAKSETRVNQ